MTGEEFPLPLIFQDESGLHRHVPKSMHDYDIAHSRFIEGWNAALAAYHPAFRAGLAVAFAAGQDYAADPQTALEFDEWFVEFLRVMATESDGRPNPQD